MRRCRGGGIGGMQRKPGSATTVVKLRKARKVRTVTRQAGTGAAMSRWGRRAGVAFATGAVVAALVLGIPAVAFADGGAASTPDGSATSEPAPTDSTPPSTTPPSTTPPSTTPPSTTPPSTGAPLDPTSPGTTSPATTSPDTTSPDTTAPAEAPSVLLTPTLTATPSSGLVNLQHVTVTGAGFSPNVPVGWAECKSGSTGQAGCDINNVGFATTDATGAFSASYTVRRILHTANGPVDCATAPETCTIGAAKSSDSNEKAGAPLTFDPTVPLPPPPTLLAGPTTDLVEGQSVALFGGGFVPSGQVLVAECLTPSSMQNCVLVGNVAADAKGSFITTVQVHRSVAQLPFGITDCAAAADTCRLVTVSSSDYDFEQEVALDFDPSGPLPTGSITVTPGSGLVQFQTVTVAGTGFAGPGAQTIQCKSAATSAGDCNQNGYAFVPVTGAGTFTEQFSVRRILHLEAGDFDCASAPGACKLVAVSFGSAPIVASANLDFDASVPAPPPPAISVAPDAGLVSGQQVTVTGSHFQPSSFVQLGECLTDAESTGYCPFASNAFAQTDGNGAFTTSLTVRRGVPDFTSFPPAVVDCAGAVQQCSVQAFSGTGDTASAPIDFDPSVPVKVPAVTVSPRLGLPDRGLVDVHATGLAPGEQVVVSECADDAPNFGFGCTNGLVNFLTADANGVVDTSVRVHRVITYSPGIVVISDTENCAAAVDACVLRVQSVDELLAVTDVPLGFDPTAVAPGPVLATTPGGPYTDGQQVEVHGSGFTPHATLGVAQCQSGVEPDGHTCDSNPGLFDEFAADGNGEFTRTVTMHTHVDSTDATIDCGATGPGCVLFAANRNDYGDERVAVAITFVTGATTGGPTGGPADAPAETVTVVPATRTLAFTGAGSRVVPLAVTGLSLLLAGGLLVLLTRRRRLDA